MATATKITQEERDLLLKALQEVKYEPSYFESIDQEGQVIVLHDMQYFSKTLIDYFLNFSIKLGKTVIIVDSYSRHVEEYMRVIAEQKTYFLFDLIHPKVRELFEREEAASWNKKYTPSGKDCFNLISDDCTVEFMLEHYRWVKRNYGLNYNFDTLPKAEEKLFAHSTISNVTGNTLFTMSNYYFIPYADGFFNTAITDKEQKEWLDFIFTEILMVFDRYKNESKNRLKNTASTIKKSIGICFERNFEANKSKIDQTKGLLAQLSNDLVYNRRVLFETELAYQALMEKKKEREAAIDGKKITLALEEALDKKFVYIKFDEYNAQFTALTRPVYLRYEYVNKKDSRFDCVKHLEGKYFYIGQFLITITMNGQNNSISFLNTTNRRATDGATYNRFTDHPHIFDGHACWGNMDAAVHDLLSKQEILPILLFLWDYLHTYNETHTNSGTGGRGVDNIHLTKWPLVSERKQRELEELEKNAK